MWQYFGLAFTCAFFVDLVGIALRLLTVGEDSQRGIETVSQEAGRYLMMISAPVLFLGLCTSFPFAVHNGFVPTFITLTSSAFGVAFNIKVGVRRFEEL